MHGVICYRFSVKWKKIMALPNGLHQRGLVGTHVAGKVGTTVQPTPPCNVSMHFFHYIITFITNNYYRCLLLI